MLGAIIGFELRSRLRRLSTWIYFAVFLAFAFLMFIAAGGAFSQVSLGFGTGGKLYINSPFPMAGMITTVSYFALLVIAAVSGQAVHQDFANDSHGLIFTKPVSKGAYLGGRFLGAMIVLLVVQAAAGIGCFAGSLMPFLDQKMIGPNRLGAYVIPYLVIVIPNLLILGTLFFALGALTRKMRAVYVTSVVLLIGYLLAAVLSQRLEDKTAAALLDPFGSFAFNEVTDYWTLAEKNTRNIPLQGILLANRLVWLALAAALFGYTFRRFRMAEPPPEGSGKKLKPAPDAPAIAVAPAGRLAFPAAAPPQPWRLLPRLAWLNFRETVKNVYFLVIVLAGVLFVVLSSRAAGAIYGTTTYPVTYAMIALAGGGFGVFILIIVTIYAGELVWREREARADQLLDAMPVPDWLYLASKLAALLLVGLVLHLVAIACGLGLQVSRGYYRFELGLYAKDLLGLQMVSFVQVACLALFVQVLVNHRAVGYFVMVLYYIALLALGPLGFEHRLYRYGSDSGYTYSDMNRYGHFLRPWFWWNLYWSLAALVLALASHLLWVRGQETSLRRRLAIAAARLRWPVRVALGTAVVGFVAAGAFIFYNTNVLNKYRTSEDGRRQQVDYERKYKKLEKEPQPRITGVQVAFDIDPARRTLRARGTFRLRNKNEQPVKAVYINLVDQIEVHRLQVGNVARATRVDEVHDFHTFELPAPLAPGEELALEFDLGYAPKGFPHNVGAGPVVANGTFVHSTYLPRLGYVAGAELSDDDERRKRGLPERPRMRDLNDAAARRDNYISSDGDWITLEASACTSPDQIAIIPGYLQRQWDQDGKRCFAYQTDGRILNFFSVLSARYQIRRDRWKDVAIEIYYHPGHEYNLDRMIRSVKASLDYFTTNFSPYQHRQVRILEFPRYQTFAQSFPNTIPYSESIGFIAEVDPKDDEDVDFPYYVTSHEVAHQWWAHQVIGANVQGATLMSESLSQYSALMVMKQTFGASQMKRFLRYELDRYLTSRGLERKKELPLQRVENQQYIHYNKASLVFYALQDYLGEETVNRALASYIKKVGYQEPPYTISTELLDELRAVTPADLRYLITDLFETITLFENRAVSAKARARAAGGGFDVTINVASRKLRADELGNETELPMNDLVDIGVLDAAGKPLYLQKHRLTTGTRDVTVTVQGTPVKAGVDPLNKLIDRKPDDNVVTVER